MSSQQKILNKQQTELRRVMMNFDQYDEALRLFFNQHAILHSVNMAETDLWSYEDEILNNMSEVQIRRIPQNSEHSVLWCIWHIARIEDVTMNLLVAGSPQVYNQDNWGEQVKSPIHDTANEISVEMMSELSNTIDIDALRAYRIAVGRRTREIVEQLEPESLKEMVDLARLQRVLDEGAVVDRAQGVIDYWSRRNIAGLLLMPATRHHLVHLNEAFQLSTYPKNN